MWNHLFLNFFDFNFNLFFIFSVPSILRNTRYRRDQRQLEEEEEIWFNEEDDFSEVPTSNKPDLDSTLGKLKIFLFKKKKN